MSDRKSPNFSERRTYRRRRLVDAVRLLPFLGFLLFFVPLLSSPGGSLANAGLYIFAAWAFLIALAGVLSRLLTRGGSNWWDGSDR